MKILLTLLFSSIVLFGLTLEESIELALQNSPKVLISKSNIKYNEYIKDEAEGAYHPTLDSSFTWRKLENPTSFAFSPSYNFNLSLKYNLFNGLSDYANVSSKESELKAARFLNKAVVSDIKLSVIVAYTNYLKAKRVIKSQEEQLASLTKQYDDTKARYEQGIIAKNDLLLIDVEKLRAKQTLIKAKSDFVIAKSDLENVTATQIAQGEIIDDFDASVQEVESIELLEDKMFENRSEIKVMLSKRKSLKYQKDIYRGNYLPKVDLEVAHQINDQKRSAGTAIIQEKQQTTYGVNVTWALYSGLRNRAMQKATLEKENQQNFELHQLKLDLKNQLRKSYEAYIVAKSAKNVAARAKESAEENYRITSDRYSYGDVDTLTLLVSQSTLTQATNEDNNAYYNLYVAYKTLERVVSE